MQGIRILFAGVLVLFSTAPWLLAQDQPRYALIVGIEDYEIGQLRNPVNDARSMAAALLEADFQVHLHENLDTGGFENAIDDFLDILPPNAIGLFYYAGHAIQKDGRNYLLPTNIKAGSADSILSQSIVASDLLSRFHDSGVEFSIFILDACRNNPFTTDNAEDGRGLASMESDVGETLIGFATQAGEVAYDGTGLNSPYTGALVNEIYKNDKDILDVFRSVRRSVRIWTNGQQRPFISASIERKFAFRSKDSQSDTVSSGSGEITPDTVLAVIERIWWDTIRESRVPDDLRAFVSHFPSSEFALVARNMTVKLEETGGAVRGLDLVKFEIPKERRSVHGLSEIVTKCDIVAGDPDDPRRITDGVPWGLVNVRRGIQDCSAALAADPTNPRLLHQMGRLMDIRQQYSEAEGFYRLAAGFKYDAALVNLGFMYVSAKGRERDYAKAMTFYRRAADLGNLRARTNIGEMFERGWSVDKNLDEAVLWYSLAAQNGWPNALDTLANRYRKGRNKAGQGVEKDLNEAIRLYRIASELGNTNAMNNLGRLYLSGDLGEPDVVRGIDYLARASELGNRFAPFNLGRLYRDGKLIERDYDVALAQFERSADLGFAPARIAIGRLHQNGQGVPKSADTAAFHYVLASMTANGKRPREREEALERLEGLKIDQNAMDKITSEAKNWLRLNGG